MALRDEALEKNAYAYFEYKLIQIFLTNCWCQTRWYRGIHPTMYAKSLFFFRRFRFWMRSLSHPIWERIQVDPFLAFKDNIASFLALTSRGAFEFFKQQFNRWDRINISKVIETSKTYKMLINLMYVSWGNGGSKGDFFLKGNTTNEYLKIFLLVRRCWCHKGGSLKEVC